MPPPHPLDKTSLAKEGGYQCSCESLHRAVFGGMEILLQPPGCRLRTLLAASHFQEAAIKLSQKIQGTHTANIKPQLLGPTAPWEWLIF